MPGVNKKELKKAFEKSWTKATAFPGDSQAWSPKKPSIGQCAVTSLVVNDLFGGKILYNKDFHHYWNLLDDGTMIDLTRDQFGSRKKIDNYVIASREHILHSVAAKQAKTAYRYGLLKRAIAKLFLVEVEK